MPYLPSDFYNLDLAKIYEAIAAGGGGGLSFWEETQGTDVGGRTYSRFTPIAGNESVIFVPRNNGGIYVDVPDGGVIGGNARGGNSNDLQHVRNNAIQVASGLRSVISGGENNKASGDLSTISGGVNNIASAYASASVGEAATASGVNSMCFAYLSTCAGQGAFVGGGNNVAGGSFSATFGRYQNTSGAYQFAGGYSHTGGGSYSSAFGRNHQMNAATGFTIGSYGRSDLGNALTIGMTARSGVGYKAKSVHAVFNTVTTLGDAATYVLSTTNTYGTLYTEILIRDAEESVSYHFFVIVRATSTSGAYTQGDTYVFEIKGAAKNIAGVGSIVYTSAIFNNGGDASLAALGLSLSFSIVNYSGFNHVRATLVNPPLTDTTVNVTATAIIEHIAH